MRYRFLRFPEGKAKAVTLSYDDGCIQDIRFSDIISRYNMKATFNLNGERLRNGVGLSRDDVKNYILSRGHEIAVHGYYHKAEGSMRPIEGIRDVLDCRLELENLYGRIIRGMAYPDSGITFYANDTNYQKVKQYLSELDIVYSRTLGGDNNAFALPNDWHCWMPTAHHNNPQLMAYIDEFLNLDLSANAYLARRQPRLFYLWGHSYEFDNNNNWDLIENICKKFSQSTEIWFATNIEIYEYVQAYHSLVYSADGSMVYNPTLFTIWFDIDGTLYKIEPGETKKIN